MHEHNTVRQVYIEAVSQIEGPQASVALAERVLFDVNADIRAAALEALKGRSAADYLPTLLGGFTYPWPAVADHAAEALVALELRDAVPSLISLLDARDPDQPFAVDTEKKRLPMVPELVRINHLRNCLLCHAPSLSITDPVRGVVPNSLHPVPLPTGPRVVVGGGGWKGGGGGGGGGGGAGGKYGPKPTTVAFDWVRADTTFLKQDFSVFQPVTDHGKFWPPDQRFDYLIRLRPLAKKELLERQEKLEGPKPVSPQKEALLFALRELTGEDAGPSPEDWQRLYSPVTGQRLETPLEPKDRALYLKDQLLKAPPARQEELLKAFQDRDGLAYDRAVALAILEMTATLQKKARTFLADRMFCVSVTELGERLRDDSPEMRLAAVKACRQREEKALVPDLIEALNDASPDVAKLSREVLRHFTLHDFGPPPQAGPEQRREAIAAWRDWWKQQEQKRAEQKRAGS
jgi:hypothetical protein